MVRNLDVENLSAKAPAEAHVDYFHNVNKPMLLYCENVLPRFGGFNSVGYATLASALLTPSGAKHIFTARMHDLATGAIVTPVVVWFGTTAEEVEYLTAAAHATVALPVAYPTPSHIAHVDTGYSAYFLLSDGTTSDLYDFGTTAGVPSFDLVTLTGISAGDLNLCRFACAAGNYLILAKEDGTVFWGNPADITDLTPSLATGAGFLIPVGLAGRVIGLAAWGDGFIVHTTGGSIVARYSNNAQIPWQFSSLVGSSAVQASVIAEELATTIQPTDVVQYSWTAAGLQQATIAQHAQGLFADVGDFLASELTENLVAGMPVLEYPAATDLASQVDVMVARLGPRYLVISYGRITATNPHFTYALVYDMQVRRWGKLKVNHVQAVYLPPELSGAETLRQLGFLSDTGDLIMVYEERFFAGTFIPHTATVVFAGISLVRGGVSQLNKVSLNIGEDSPEVTVSYTTSNDNMNFGPLKPMQLISSGSGSGKYGCRSVGAYHAISVTGKFSLTAVEVEVRKAGQR